MEVKKKKRIIIRGKEEKGKIKKIEIWHKGTGPNEDKATHLTHLESESDQQGVLSQSPRSAAGRRAGMGPFGRGVYFINLTVRLWKLSGSSHVSCHSVEIGCWSAGWGERWGVSGGGAGKRFWGVKGESGGKGNHTHMASAHTKWNEGEKNTQCIPSGWCEGATGKDNNIRGERGGGKGFLLFRTPVKHTEATGRLN